MSWQASDRLVSKIAEEVECRPVARFYRRAFEGQPGHNPGMKHFRTMAKEAVAWLSIMLTAGNCALTTSFDDVVPTGAGGQDGRASTSTVGSAPGVVPRSSFPPSPTPSGQGGLGAAGAVAPAANTISGMLGGQAFNLRSGFGARIGGESLDLILSSAEGLCDSTTSGKLHAGEMIVQAFGLQGTAPGVLTSDEVKYASVASGCQSGAAVENNVSRASDATSASISVTRLTTSVDGTLDIRFQDGSYVSGSFSVPFCALQADFEDAVCF
jgi:hypothetical protein